MKTKSKTKRKHGGSRPKAGRPADLKEGDKIIVSIEPVSGDACAVEWTVLGRSPEMFMFAEKNTGTIYRVPRRSGKQ